MTTSIWTAWIFVTRIVTYEKNLVKKNVMTAGLMRYTKKKNKKWKDISINE